MLVHEEEKCFSLHKLDALTKTFQHLKQWQPTSIVSALSLESVRIVNRYEVHKRPKTTVVVETSFLLAKPNGYPTFHGEVFQWARFCNGVSHVGEHISLGTCVSQVGEHISLGIMFCQVGEHISLGICVFQVREHI